MLNILADPINVEHYFLNDHPVLTILLAITFFALIIGLFFLCFCFASKGISKISDIADKKKKKKLEQNQDSDEKRYCKNCGAELCDDSTDCRYCGAPLTQPTVPKQIKPVPQLNDPEKDEHSRDTKIIGGIIIAIIVLVLITLSIYAIAYSDSVSTQKKATNYDVIIQTSTSLFSYNITLTPKKNIDNLEITFEFYGDNNQKIATKTKVVGNVKKNTRYDISFSISEFSLASLTSISKFKWNVTGGTVNTE